MAVTLINTPQKEKWLGMYGEYLPMSNVLTFPTATVEVSVHIDFTKTMKVQVPQSVMIEIKALEFHDEDARYELLEPYIRKTSTEAKLEYQGTSVFHQTDILYHSTSEND